MLLLLLEAPLDVPHMPVNCNSSFQGAVNFIGDAAMNLLGGTDFVFYNMCVLCVLLMEEGGGVVPRGGVGGGLWPVPPPGGGRGGGRSPLVEVLTPLGEYFRVTTGWAPPLTG